MNYVCGDNRFEIIERYKNKLISATNIESSPDEMAALDNILYRFWQMGWLKEQEAKTGHWVSVNDGDVVAIDNDGFPERACFCSECRKYLIASDEYAVYGRYCPFCGTKMESR